jgi:hypothetical protein
VATGSLAPSRRGILFVSGFTTSLRVERGHLTVRTGEGRDIREGRLSRVSRPRIRRVLVYGKGGCTTWGALEWIEGGIGASSAVVSRDGGIVACSAEAGPNQPALRRAQVAAAETEVGLQIVRELLMPSLKGSWDCFDAHCRGRTPPPRPSRAAIEPLPTRNRLLCNRARSQGCLRVLGCMASGSNALRSGRREACPEALAQLRGSPFTAQHFASQGRHPSWRDHEVVRRSSAPDPSGPLPDRGCRQGTQLADHVGADPGC